MTDDTAKNAQLLELLAELGYTEEGTVLAYEDGELVEYWTEKRISHYLGHTPGTSTTRLWCATHNVTRERLSPISRAQDVIEAHAQQPGQGHRRDLR